MRIRNGDMIHVANQDTKFSGPAVGGSQPKMEEEKKKQGDTEMIDTTTNHGSPVNTNKQKSSKPKTEEEVKKSHCNHGPNGKCVNCLGVTKDTLKEIKEKCKHGPNEKCPNCT